MKSDPQPKLPSEIRYIAIEGVIGAGKTTLARMLSEKLAPASSSNGSKKPVPSEVYEDPERYAFQTQIFFLLSPTGSNRNYSRRTCSTRISFPTTFREGQDLRVFDSPGRRTEAVRESACVDREEHPQPDLVIYLQSSVDRLMKNIRMRVGRWKKPCPSTTSRN